MQGVIANMVTLKVDGPVAQNEICYIETGGDKLMSEVIKVVGENVFVQVFESTRGLTVGAPAEFTGHMLEVTLGPGMLSHNYDGLQNDLDKMTGVFLKRGEYTYPLDNDRLWKFEPIVKVGDVVRASDWLGKVEENFQPLKIMAPFQLEGEYTVKKIAPEGEYRIIDEIAVLENAKGDTVSVNMIQKWPVKVAMTNYREILNEWRRITQVKGASIVVLDMPLLDTRTSTNGVTGELISDIVLQLLSYVAQVEREHIKQRQAEGIASAKARGVKFGRPRIPLPPQFDQVRTAVSVGRMTRAQAARALGVSASTFDRWVRAHRRGK